jgi:hypothetical protein
MARVLLINASNYEYSTIEAEINIEQASEAVERVLIGCKAKP